ncbi:hypothetical protein LIER_09279 [Lithospermum erythrorhizon]|uniref:Uncharacterized protein n=1 Tax=Lithospermum erythrorhizon TaxID=34254 RepID=A0AAV3PGR7_LITER
MSISLCSTPRFIPILKTLAESFSSKGMLLASSCGFPFFGIYSGTCIVHTFLYRASPTLLDEDPASIRALISFVDSK